MKNKLLYCICLLAAMILLLLAFTVFAKTQWLGGAFIGLGIYLLLGAIIKLCKASEKLKDTVLTAIDLLF